MTCKDCIHSGLCYKENDYDNFPDRCGDFISNKVLEERAKGKWIPVSERLPEEGQIVIVTDDRGKVFEYELNPLDVDKYTTGKWRFLEHKIIAWQPLPKPYKEADNETDN